MSDIATIGPQASRKLRRVIRAKSIAKPAAKTPARVRTKTPAAPGSTDAQSQDIAGFARAAEELRGATSADPALRRTLLKRIAPKPKPRAR